MSILCAPSGFSVWLLAVFWVLVSPQKLQFLRGFLCESLQGKVGIALESPDQKTREFIFQIALLR
jgi:hypothetical protein